jgi:hypothetical protein
MVENDLDNLFTQLSPHEAIIILCESLVSYSKQVPRFGQMQGAVPYGSSLVANCLRGMDKILTNADNCAELLDTIEESGGLDVLEELQSHQSQETYELASHMLEHYFAVGQEDEDEYVDDTTAAVPSHGVFQF